METRHPAGTDLGPSPSAPGRDRSLGPFALALAIATLLHLAGLMLLDRMVRHEEVDRGTGGAGPIEILLTESGRESLAAQAVPLPEPEPKDVAQSIPSDDDTPPSSAAADDIHARAEPPPGETPIPMAAPTPTEMLALRDDHPLAPSEDPLSAADPAPIAAWETAILEPDALPRDSTSEPKPEPESEPATERDGASPLDPLNDPLAPDEESVDVARILASRGDEITRLTSERQGDSSLALGQPRRKRITASTHEFRYASYLSAWTRKVERIGHLNYPQAAREQRLYGSLILEVALRSDGTLERIRVVRSSGYPLLDEAAVRIVELGAPYAPFPPDIAAETDVLDIVRTWQFLQGGRLGWEQ
jgi:protein TonB